MVCRVYLLEFPKISLNIHLAQLSEEFHRDSKTEFKSASVNNLSVFESLKLKLHYENRYLQSTLTEASWLETGLVLM